MKFVEKTSKSVDEAVKLALEELNATLADVEVEVIEGPTKGFLGFGNKDAKVKVTLKADPSKRAKDFLDGLFSLTGEDVTVSTTLSDNTLNIDLSGPDMGIVIGKRGETLDALQHLASLAANRGDFEFIKVSVDCENYRLKRNETLAKLANRLSQKVIKTGKNVTLEPMNAYERRIIHETLQNSTKVSTYSVGQGSSRKVVITSKERSR